MQVQGNVNINAPRGQVWAFLTDPQAVGRCAPGLESLDVVAPGEKFKAVASVGFGSMKVRFTVDVEWTELDEPDHAQMRAHGTAPGSTVDASSEMNLSDGEGGGTRLDWSADINVQGTIASLASRLMGSMTQKMTGEFFNCVKREIEG
jgi:carbon monoxide dehydrogenase subunit G